MKKILVTGVNSYIGNSFRLYMKQFPEYQVDGISVRNNYWRGMNFTNYDCIFQVAGIAHRKETKENVQLYYDINRNLTIELAKKAKAEGVKQFIFLSSMSVYGMNTGVITKETIPNPKSTYGISKLQAEEGLQELSDNSFKVCILRPPMVYGKECKGNFQAIVKIVKRFPIFPRIKNQRSMIYIENLCAFVKLCAGRELAGLYCPQNKEYVRTDEMAGYIAQKIGKKIYKSYFLGVCTYALRVFMSIAKKAFGSLIYLDCEDFDYSYCEIGFKESVLNSL